jgi:Ca2+/Na+ antiporter
LQHFWFWLKGFSFGLQWLLGAVALVLLILVVVSIIRNRKFFARAFWRWNLIPLLAACLVHIVYYKALGHIAQKGWYWIAEMLFVILLLGIVIEAIANETRKLPHGNKLVPASVSLLTIALVLPYAQTSYRAITYAPAQEHFYLQRAHFLEENTEPGALIGMTGSGSSGYFVQDRTVVNLDGLISSMEYFVHLQNATADEYLKSIGLDYVFGNAYILQNTNPYQWNFENRLEEFQYFEVDDDKTLVLFRFR